jgi:hypothetical protein
MQRFSALMNGVFVGVGVIFLIWGATDIAFPIAERMSVAVFGLMRIILGIISLSVGIGVEAVQWAKIGGGKELNPEKPTEPSIPQILPTKVDSPAMTESSVNHA